MSKKTGKRQNRKPDVTKEAGYYRLKTQAVKDLVEADESNSPEVSKEESKEEPKTEDAGPEVPEDDSNNTYEKTVWDPYGDGSVP